MILAHPNDDKPKLREITGSVWEAVMRSGEALATGVEFRNCFNFGRP